MTIRSFLRTIPLVFMFPLAVQAQGLVKVTPLGGQEGEFCRFDRAMIFEDPNGTRILYDAGRTVAGAEDPRLGKIDVVLISHMHGDHLGDRHNPAPNAGSCDKPDISVSALPNSGSVNIAVKTGAKIVTGSEMPSFLANKPQLAVMNIGDTFTTGPREAAYVINELVKPRAVIASHANEVATLNDKVIAGTKTEQFMKVTKVPVHVPLSGKTMRFDGKGKCTAGC